MYRVVPLFNEETRAEWPDSPHWVVEGKLEDQIIISVPVTTSMSRIRKICDEATKELGKPVTVITHNMEFLVAKKLPPKEAAATIKRIEDYAEERERAFHAAAEQVETEAPSGGAEGAERDDQAETKDVGDG